MTERTPQETFDLAEELGRLNIFGKWTERYGNWYRLEPCRHIPDTSRVTVYFVPLSDDDAEGWYYRIGCDVLSIAPVTSSKPFSTAEEAKAAVDARLKSCPNTVVVD